MREYWGSGYTISGGGGGGAGGNTLLIQTSIALAKGSIVSLDASGQLQLADPSLALSPEAFNAIGVSKAVYAPGDFATVYSDEILVAPMLFSAAPLAADNGKGKETAKAKATSQDLLRAQMEKFNVLN